MPDLPGGERPKSALDWIYKLALALCFVLFFAGKMYVDANYVNKDAYQKDRSDDRAEYKKDRDAAENRQREIIEQNKQMLVGITEIKVRMEGNIVRDKNYDELKQKVETLETYVYTHK